MVFLFSVLSLMIRHIPGTHFFFTSLT